MSAPPDTRTLWITPLSPVHMGTDEDYVPTHYVIEGDVLFEFDHRALAGLPAAERNALSKLLDGPPDARLLKRIQSFIYGRREYLIPAAVNVVKTCKGIAALYEARIGRAANVESGGREVYNLLEIERAAYHPADRRLLLPGSGLKGAIRTALLDDLNQHRPLPHDLDLKKDPHAHRKLQEHLFDYSYSELYRDPMRLVQVSDSHWCGPEAASSAEILFAVNRKKHPDGRDIRSQAERNDLYQLLECAAPFRIRAFRGTLTISDVRKLGDHPELPRYRFGFADIARACNAFYRPIFKRERDALKQRGFLDSHWRQTVDRLLGDSDLKRRLDANRAFLLRAGRHSGAESVTLNGVRSIKIMKGKEKSPEWASEAKTWWLAAAEKDDQRHLQPFGWLLVEYAPAEGHLPPGSPYEAYMPETEAWLKKVKDRMQALKGRLEASRAREAEKEERRLREEEAAKRLAAMGEEERRIETLRKLFEQEKASGRLAAGSEVNQKRLELLDEALGWQDPELRCKAAKLLEDIASALPWAKKRKAEVKQKLLELKGETCR